MKSRISPVPCQNDPKLMKNWDNPESMADLSELKLQQMELIKLQKQVKDSLAKIEQRLGRQPLNTLTQLDEPSYPDSSYESPQNLRKSMIVDRTPLPAVMRSLKTATNTRRSWNSSFWDPQSETAYNSAQKPTFGMSAIGKRLERINNLKWKPTSLNNSLVTGIIKPTRVFKRWVFRNFMPTY